jgi:carboxymethylenebutenolidase
MNTYESGTSAIRIYEQEVAEAGQHPALLLLHGSGGSVSYWVDRFGPALANFGVAAYAAHYFDKTGTSRATPETILDGRHFNEWLTAIRDALTYIAARPSVDPQRIAVLGISLGAYLALALAVEDARVRAVIELSGGMPGEWEDRINAGMPPVLILHGVEDAIVPVSEARKLQGLLERHKIPHEIVLMPGETHWFSAASQPKLLMTCASFLARYL